MAKTITYIIFFIFISLSALAIVRPPINIIYNPMEEPGVPETLPGERDIPYKLTCFTNCMPQMGAEFTESNCRVRMPNPATGAGFDCATLCRYHDDDPVLKPEFDIGINGIWNRFAGGRCPPDESSNCDAYIFGDDFSQTVSDGGCDEALPSVIAHLGTTTTTTLAGN